MNNLITGPRTVSFAAGVINFIVEGCIRTKHYGEVRFFHIWQIKNVNVRRDVINFMSTILHYFALIMIKMEHPCV